VKTLLLWPAFGEEYSRYPPLGVAYLAAVLREHSFPVEIVDAARYANEKEFEADLQATQPDVLGVSVPSIYYDKAVAAARAARRILPDVPIVFGGALPTALPEEMLENPEVDVVVFGEGEFKLLNLLRGWKDGIGIDQVKGIYYKSGGTVLKTPDEGYIENLDAIPFPARDLLPMREYLRLSPTLPLPYPATSIVPTRGCYGNCRFCQPTLKKLFGRRIRYRSPKNVVDEIIQLKDTYHLSGIYFADDEPTWERDWMLELCEEMVQREVKVSWICPSRVDTVDLPLLQAMKKAGCIQVGFGVESGSQRILNYYRKGVKAEQVAPAFSMCREAGIIARMNIMIGAPTETKEDVQETIQMLEQVRPDLIAVSVTTPTVGSDLFNDATEEGLLRKDSLSEYNRFDISTMERVLSDADIRLLIQETVRTYMGGIAKIVLNPVHLYQRRYLFYHVFMHWFTMIKNPLGLVRDISYYLRYARKESME
jgi:radical SAM superfamily enzyme YgiQ (UPF0313 family)